MSEFQSKSSTIKRPKILIKAAKIASKLIYALGIYPEFWDIAIQQLIALFGSNFLIWKAQ